MFNKVIANHAHQFVYAPQTEEFEQTPESNLKSRYFRVSFLVDLSTGVVVPTTCSLTTCLTTCICVGFGTGKLSQIAQACGNFAETAACRTPQVSASPGTLKRIGTARRAVRAEVLARE